MDAASKLECLREHHRLMKEENANLKYDIRKLIEVITAARKCGHWHLQELYFKAIRFDKVFGASYKTHQRMSPPPGVHLNHNKMKKRILHLEDIIKHLKADILHYKHLLNKTLGRLEDRESRVSELEGKHVIHKKAKLTLEMSLAHYENELRTTVLSLDATRSENHKLKLGHQKRYNNDTEHSDEEDNVPHSKSKEILQEKVDELQDRNAHLTTQADEYSQKATTAGQEMIELENSVSNLKRDLSVNRQSKDLLQDRMDDVQAMNTQLQNLVDEYKHNSKIDKREDKDKKKAHSSFHEMLDLPDISHEELDNHGSNHGSNHNMLSYLEDQIVQQKVPSKTQENHGSSHKLKRARKEEVAQYKEVVKNLNKEAEQNNAQFKEMHNKIMELKNIASTQDKQLSRSLQNDNMYLGQLEQLSAKNERLESSLHDYKQKYASSIEKLSDNDSTARKFQEEIEDRINTEHQKNKMLEELWPKLRETENEVHEGRLSLSHSESIIEDLTGRLNSMKDELAKAHQKVDQHVEAINIVCGKLETAQQEAIYSDERATNHKIRIETYQKAHQHTNHEFANLREQMKQLEYQCDDHQSDRQMHIQQIGILQKQKDEMLSDIASKEHQSLYSEEKFFKLKQSLSATQESLRNKVSEVVRQEQLCQSLQAELGNIADRNMNHLKEIDNAKALINTLHNDIIVATQESQSKREECINHQNMAMTLQMQLEGTEREKLTLEEQVMPLQNLASSQGHKLSVSQQSKDELNNQLRTLNEQNEHLEKMLQSYKVKLTDSLNQLSKNEDLVKMYKSELSIYQQDHLYSNKDLAEKAEKVTKLELSLAQLQESRNERALDDVKFSQFCQNLYTVPSTLSESNTDMDNKSSAESGYSCSHPKRDKLYYHDHHNRFHKDGCCLHADTY